MPNLGFPEILMILLVALVVFGPRKLPELGKSLGAGLREFRRSTQGLKEEFEGVMKDAEATNHTAQPIAQATVQAVPAAAPVTVISAQPQVILAQEAAVAPGVTVAPVQTAKPSRQVPSVTVISTRSEG